MNSSNRERPKKIAESYRGIERIDLPPEIRDHPSLVICERLSAECTFLYVFRLVSIVFDA